MAVEQSGVSFGAEAAACSRGPALGSPYPIQLGFVIGSPRLKDTVHHLTRLNACKMSNQRRVWSLRPAVPGLLPAGPRRPLWSSQEQISVSLSHEIPVPGFIYTGGNLHRHGCPPYIKLVKYSMRVETLLTPISHPILNEPTMEADTCGFFVASEVSRHSVEKDSQTGFFFFSSFFCYSVLKPQKHHVSCISFFIKIRVLSIVLHTNSASGICTVTLSSLFKNDTVHAYSNQWIR